MQGKRDCVSQVRKSLFQFGLICVRLIMQFPAQEVWPQIFISELPHPTAKNLTCMHGAQPGLLKYEILIIVMTVCCHSFSLRGWQNIPRGKVTRKRQRCQRFLKCYEKKGKQRGKGQENGLCFSLRKTRTERKRRMKRREHLPPDFLRPVCFRS